MPIPPIFVVDLFPEVGRELIALLRSLSPAEWQRPTVSSKRTVKDVASHLLDGSPRRLSLQRDGHQSADVRPREGEALIDFIHRFNAEWEIGTKRLGPRVIIDWMETADLQLAEFFRSLDPYGPAFFPVAWAGEEESENWMDLAREYTEKWHHTQQVFAATGRPSTILNRRLGYPCLDIFLRALPFTYRHVAAPEGSIVSLQITGEAGGEWHIERRDHRWLQVASIDRPASAVVVMDQETAWKLVTKRRTRDAIRREFSDIAITGDVSLGNHALGMISVMA